MNINSPTEVRKVTSNITYFIALYESYKDYIVNYAEEFYEDLSVENGEIIEIKHSEKIDEVFNNSKKRVSKKLFGNILPKYLTWYLENGILNENDIEFLRICTYVRNELTHNLLEYLMGKELSPANTEFSNNLEEKQGKPLDIKTYIDILSSIYSKTSNNIFIEIENPTNPHPVNESEIDGEVKSGNSIYYDYISMCLFDKNKAEYFYNKYKKQSK